MLLALTDDELRIESTLPDRLPASWSHSQANKDFIGDSAVVSYLGEKGDNDEIYGNGTSLCVRVPQHLRICPHSSSQVERRGAYRIQGLYAVDRLPSKLSPSKRQRYGLVPSNACTYSIV
jgi:hypothetical protein